MHFYHENKKAIIGGILAVLLVWAYFTYFPPIGKPENLLTSSVQNSALAGAQLLSALGQLQGVKLDDAIFKDPAFRSLVDFGIEIPEQAVGRKNPFAPLPAFGGSAAALPSGITTGTANR